MRRSLITLLICVAAMFSTGTKSNAQTQVLIDYWSFDDVDSTSAMLVPNTSIVGGAGLAYLGAYYDSVQPGTVLNAVGTYTVLNSGSAALRLRNPAEGAFTLTLPTTGYKDITLKYAEQRTKSGSQENIVTYTVDGTTWINTAISAVATYVIDSVDTGSNGWQLETFSFSSDANVNNNPHFAVQINFAIGDSGTSGNDRFDNITLYGISDTSHTGISSISPSESSYTLYPNPVMNNLEINGYSEGDKAIVITDIVGQTIYRGIKSGKQFTINTSQLIAGNYFISIKESDSGRLTTMKFVKQ